MFIPLRDFEADGIKISLHFEGSQVSKIIQAYLDINPSAPADLSITLKIKNKKKEKFFIRERKTHCEENESRAAWPAAPRGSQSRAR